jgi:hypothetical protein
MNWKRFKWNEWGNAQNLRTGYAPKDILNLGSCSLFCSFYPSTNKLNYRIQVLADPQLFWTWQRIPKSCCRQVSSSRLSSHTGTLYWFWLPGSHYLSVYTHTRLYIFVCLSACPTHPTVRLSARPYILLSVWLCHLSFCRLSVSICLPVHPSVHTYYIISEIYVDEHSFRMH